MGRFKKGDKVIPSRQMREQCEVSEWFERVKDKVKDDGYMVISQVYGSGTYIAEGLPSIVFREEWLEPYIDCEPSPLNLGRAAYMPREKWLPCDAPAYLEEISVRDRFAMAALMCFRADLFTAPEYVAEKAYKVADAMMEVRKI